MATENGAAQAASKSPDNSISNLFAGFKLFYVYEDERPYLAYDPEDKINAALADWVPVDDNYTETNDDANWLPVNEYLESRGIKLLSPDDITYVSLDDIAAEIHSRTIAATE